MTAHTETHILTFTREMIRALQPKSYDLKMGSLIDSIATKSITSKGWSFDDLGYSEDDEYTEHGHRYYCRMRIAFQHPTNKPGSTEFASILYTLYGRAMSNAFGNWTLTEVDGNEYAAPDSEDAVTDKIDKEMIGYADCVIPDDFDSYFSHLYGLEAQIFRVKSALKAAIRSNFRNRFNVVLVGPPGCGKSDIALSLQRALGEDSVMSFDATSTTAAGFIKDVNDRDILPRVMTFEELEKAGTDAMVPLLGVTDQRGEIKKVTARGKVDRAVKCLAIATVNDYEKFSTMQAGALSSRFSTVVHFNRPDRTVLSQILHREVQKDNGDPEWVKPALDYCLDRGIDDPRRIIAFCLTGADDLLTGEYQKMMDATSAPDTSPVED
jgi:energy-coupling factor transporter ATP-binding protein EcfA2